MENSDRETTTPETTAITSHTSSTLPQSPNAADTSQKRPWLVSPLFDLLLIANLGWVLALIPGFVAPDGTVHLEFWQIYFLTTPHRWITLFLVALDPERRGNRSTRFVWIAVVGLAIVWGLRFSQGMFLCLVFVDFIWNGWHFASQHYGILRMYDRKVGGGHFWLERIGLRLFLFYVILRTAHWFTREIDRLSGLADQLIVLDSLFLLLPASLVVLALMDHPKDRLPRLAYLLSVTTLYSALLLAIGAGYTPLILSLAVAVAAFHAIEYLGIVTHYAWRRKSSGSPGLFQRISGIWTAALLGFMLVLGSLVYALERNQIEWWLGLNLWAAFMHYTYDGMIWKLRRPETARALGVNHGKS